MEFVIVTFPTDRAVRMDGLPFGRTGRRKRVEAGHHRFDLGPTADYSPPFDERNVIGTTFETPMTIPFMPLPSVVPAEAPEAPVTPAAPARKRARKRAAATRKKAAAPARKKRARKSSTARARKSRGATRRRTKTK
jgi:hypothetical protein